MPIRHRNLGTLNPTLCLKLYVWSALGTVGLALVAGIVTARSHWGYWFQRPEVLPEVATIETVERVIAVEMAESSAPQFAAVKEISPFDRPSSHYFLEERQLHALIEAKLLAANYTLATNREFANLYRPLVGTGMLVEAEPGYEDQSDSLEGLIVVGSTATGEHLALVSLTSGRQVSNDHYPYYELVFEIDPVTNELTFQQGQQFFFDIAGFEGFEWYSFWWMYGLLGLMIVLPVTTAAIIVWAFKSSPPRLSQRSEVVE